MPDLTPDRSLRRPPPPGARDGVVRRGRRRRHRVLGAAAVAALVLTAVPLGALVVTDRGADRLLSSAEPTAPAPVPETAPPSAAPAQPCPAVYLTEGGPSAPLPPPELTDALVPREVPLSVTICRYGDIALTGGGQSPTRPDQVPLDGERTVVDGLERLPDDLAVPAGSPTGEGGFCTAIGGAVIPYLVQLQYASSTVWLSAVAEPNSCTGVGNGVFASDVYVGGQIAAAYEAGRWVPPPPPWNAPEPGPCPLGVSGRAGQERVLVPSGWQSIRVCRSAAGAQTSTVLDDDAAGALLTILDSLPTQPSPSGYTADCGDLTTRPTEVPGPYYDVVVEYPTGRGVRLYTSFGCEPVLGNGSLTATATPQQQTQLLQLLDSG